MLAKLNGAAKYIDAAVAISQRKSFDKTCEPKMTSFDFETFIDCHVSIEHFQNQKQIQIFISSYS